MVGLLILKDCFYPSCSSSTLPMKRQVFVTVGTTQFNDLVTHVMHPSTVNLLDMHGYTHLLVQSGTSLVPSLNNPAIPVDTYRYKATLQADVDGSELIISHAGCGCILESLRSISAVPCTGKHRRRKLIVVVNRLLLDNHQEELAFKLHACKYLVACVPEDLHATIQSVQDMDFLDFPAQNPALFPELLNEVFGLY